MTGALGGRPPDPDAGERLARLHERLTSAPDAELDLAAFRFAVAFAETFLGPALELPDGRPLPLRRIALDYEPGRDRELVRLYNRASRALPRTRRRVLDGLQALAITDANAYQKLVNDIEIETVSLERQSVALAPPSTDTKGRWTLIAGVRTFIRAILDLSIPREAGAPAIPFEDMRRVAHYLPAGTSTLFDDVLGGALSGATIRNECLTPEVTAIATRIAAESDSAAMPDLARALREAGCTDERIINHCLEGRPHGPDCWLIQEILDTGSHVTARRLDETIALILPELGGGADRSVPEILVRVAERLGHDATAAPGGPEFPAGLPGLVRRLFHEGREMRVWLVRHLFERIEEEATAVALRSSLPPLIVRYWDLSPSPTSIGRSGEA